MRDNASEQYLAKIGFLRDDYLVTIKISCDNHFREQPYNQTFEKINFSKLFFIITQLFKKELDQHEMSIMLDMLFLVMYIIINIVCFNVRTLFA